MSRFRRHLFTGCISRPRGPLCFFSLSLSLSWHVCRFQPCRPELSHARASSPNAQDTSRMHAPVFLRSRWSTYGTNYVWYQVRHKVDNYYSAIVWFTLSIEVRPSFPCEWPSGIFASHVCSPRTCNLFDVCFSGLHFRRSPFCVFSMLFITPPGSELSNREKGKLVDMCGWFIPRK